MNNNFILFTQWPLGLFVVAIFCALFAKRFRRKKIVFLFISAFFSAVGMVCAFIIGATLQELIIPFLILLLINLGNHTSNGGEEK